MIYIALFLFLCVYWVAPFPIQIILLIVDAFVPDPIPAIDEIFMLLAVVNRIKKYIAISNFIKTHKILTALLLIVVIVGTVFAVQGLIGVIMR